MAKAAKPAPALTLDGIGVIVTAKPVKKSSLAERVMEGVADITAIDRVIADLEDAKSVVDSAIRDAATKIFLDDGCALKAHPGNFRGCEVEIVDNVSIEHSLRVELKKSSSALSEEAKALAAEHKLPVVEVVQTHATFIVNPVHGANMDVMQAVLNALNAAIAEGTVPADILMRQEGVSKTCTTDETIPAIFRLPREDAEILLPMYSSMAIGALKHGSKVGQEDDLTPALLRTAKLINRPAFRAEMQEVAVQKKAEKARKRA